MKFRLSTSNLNHNHNEVFIPNYFGSKSLSMMRHIENCFGDGPYGEDVIDLLKQNGIRLSEFLLYYKGIPNAELKKFLFLRGRKFYASKIGLKKTAAAIHSRCDPKAMLIFEQMGGAFDGCGVYGTSFYGIEKMWYIAGCKDSPKFRLMLANEIQAFKKCGRTDFSTNSWNIIKKHHSAKNTADIFRGLKFLNNRYNLNIIKISPKKMQILGRVSLPLRYAMMRNYAETGELDFKFAAEVQTWDKKQQSELLSPKEAWFFLYGRCPFSGKDIPHPAPLAGWNKAASAFAKIVNEFQAKGDSSMLLPIFNLSVMFGSYQEVKRFVSNWSAIGIHDAGQFTVTKNFSPQKWAGFCQKYPAALKFSSLFGNVEKQIGVPKSLTELRDTCAKFMYEGSFGVEELARWCNYFNLSQEQFNSYKYLYENVKTSECCPFVQVERGAYRLFKLAANDVRGALLGHFTDCCQHLDAAGSACARHGVTDPTSAFYAVEYNGKIVAQSWAWRSKKSDIVFDSIEALSGYDINTIANLFLEAGLQIVGRLGIDRVLVGNTEYGLTSKVRSFLQNEGHDCANGLNEEMRSKCSYMDGRHQWILCCNGNKPKKFKKENIGSVSYSIGNTNVICSGSGVFCEHCDAEVHVDCEVCPNCNANIAEWV